MTEPTAKRESILGKVYTDGYRSGFNQRRQLDYDDAFAAGRADAEACAPGRWPPFALGLLIGVACGVSIAVRLG